VCDAPAVCEWILVLKDDAAQSSRPVALSGVAESATRTFVGYHGFLGADIGQKTIQRPHGRGTVLRFSMHCENG